MNDDACTTAVLVEHFENIYAAHVAGLPIDNPELVVEAVGETAFGDHKALVLITPWFMNLVLLPGTDEWDNAEQGQTCDIEMPGQTLQFTVSQDAAIGTYLSAVMFRTVSDFPDQDVAREVAEDILRRLFFPTSSDLKSVRTKPKATLSRRALLSGLGAK